MDKVRASELQPGMKMQLPLEPYVIDRVVVGQRMTTVYLKVWNPLRRSWKEQHFRARNDEEIWILSDPWV